MLIYLTKEAIYIQIRLHVFIDYLLLRLRSRCWDVKYRLGRRRVKKLLIVEGHELLHLLVPSKVLVILLKLLGLIRRQGTLNHRLFTRDQSGYSRT